MAMNYGMIYWGKEKTGTYPGDRECVCVNRALSVDGASFILAAVPLPRRRPIRGTGAFYGTHPLLAVPSFSLDRVPLMGGNGCRQGVNFAVLTEVAGGTPCPCLL